MNRSWRMTAALALGLAFLASTAGASEAPKESTADTSLASEVENYLAAAEAGDDPTTFRVFWKEGPKLETSDGKFKAAFFGRVYWDTAFRTSDDFDQGVTEDQTFFRTVRMGFSADILKNAFMKVEVDFIEDDDGVQLKDVEMGLKKLGFLGTMKAGHYKEPFSLEELTSSRFITFMERSIATSTFSPSRNDGISFGNSFGGEKKPHTWAAGIFKDTNNQGNDLENDAVDGGYNLTVRVTGLFLEDEETRRHLHAGFSFSFRDPTSEAVRYRARPGVSKGDRLVDTGTVSADDITLFCFEFAFNIQSFNVQAEFFMADVSGVAPATDPSFSGWYIQFSWWLTGENRHYKGGKYDRVKPKNNLHDGGGKWGAIELAFRYDFIDLTDAGYTGGEMTVYTFGTNWHWNANMRVMFNVVFADADPASSGSTGDTTAFEVRFQFDF